MAANQTCPAGKEITNIDHCQEATKYAWSLGLNPEKSLQIGSWTSVPYQCSAQVHYDDTFHFSTNSNTDNGRFVTGEFVMICERGIYEKYFL